MLASRGRDLLYERGLLRRGDDLRVASTGSNRQPAVGSHRSEVQGSPWFPCINISQHDVYPGNFGQKPFVWGPPAGFNSSRF